MRPALPALVLAASIAFIPLTGAAAEEGGAPPSGQSATIAPTGAGERALNYWSAARMTKAKSPRVLILNQAPGGPDKPQ